MIEPSALIELIAMIADPVVGQDARLVVGRQVGGRLQVASCQLLVAGCRARCQSSCWQLAATLRSAYANFFIQSALLKEFWWFL